MRDERDGRPARVISVGRNAAWIAFEGEEDVRLAALPKNVERLALVPGDLVAARALDGGRVLVTRREPRSFALERTTGSGRHKTMAANIDGIAIVAAFARPALHVAMLDELLAFGELHEIGAQLVFTKADLVAPEDAEAVLTLYRSLGYAALCANPKTGHGVDAI